MFQATWIVTGKGRVRGTVEARREDAVAQIPYPRSDRDPIVYELSEEDPIAAAIAAKLTTLRAEALDTWKPTGSAPIAAKARASVAWDGAIADAARGNYAGTRAFLKTAQSVAVDEGAGHEESVAIAIVDAAAKLATVTAEADAFGRSGFAGAAGRACGLVLPGAPGGEDP